jgi:hypothetical protein
MGQTRLGVSREYPLTPEDHEFATQEMDRWITQGYAEEITEAEARRVGLVVSRVVVHGSKSRVVVDYTPQNEHLETRKFRMDTLADLAPQLLGIVVDTQRNLTCCHQKNFTRSHALPEFSGACASKTSAGARCGIFSASVAWTTPHIRRSKTLACTSVHLPLRRSCAPQSPGGTLSSELARLGIAGKPSVNRYVGRAIWDSTATATLVIDAPMEG